MQKRPLYRSFQDAFSGLAYVVRTQRNARIHLIAAVLAVAFGYGLKISLTEWAIMAVTIGLVFAAEVANTAVESLVDLVSPDQHRLAKIAKDTSAAAVLVLAMASVAVGLLILGPPLWSRITP